MSRNELLTCDKCESSMTKSECWIIQGFDKMICEDCNAIFDFHLGLVRNLAIEEFFKEKVENPIDLEERLLLDAKELLQQFGKISVSLLQRKFKVSELKARELISKLKVDNDS